jgi:hypothetical protein
MKTIIKQTKIKYMNWFKRLFGIKDKKKEVKKTTTTYNSGYCESPTHAVGTNDSGLDLLNTMIIMDAITPDTTTIVEDGPATNGFSGAGASDTYEAPSTNDYQPQSDYNSSSDSTSYGNLSDYGSSSSDYGSSSSDYGSSSSDFGSSSDFSSGGSDW